MIDTIRWFTLTGLLLLAGCISEPANPAATQPATVVAPATTQPEYWLDHPAPTIAYGDFDTLWRAAEEAIRDFLFVIDRTDYRAGVMTTRPLTSKQWFEVWRPDVQTIGDLNESSLATIRRTIRFDVARLSDGTFQLSPRVLVERQATGEQRITSVVGYRGLFTRPVRVSDRPTGTRESDAGINIPYRYWYPTGRDNALENALVDSIRKKLNEPATARVVKR